MRRDFGPKSFNNTPVKGYESPEYFIAERDAAPVPAPVAEVIAQWRHRRHEEVARVAEPEAKRLGNDQLPMYEYREPIVEAIEHNPVTIIVSETGSGKSTQVPQFLYEAGYEVYLTQPRRLPAREVSERINEEIRAIIEDAPEGLVGYKTAEKDTTTENTRVTVLTDGLRLVQAVNGRGETEREVLIIDEVHEWNSNIEILVAWSKQLLKQKPNLRVVLMSATMEAQRIQNYFDDVTPVSPPIIEVPGRTFPVESHEMPGSTVVKETLRLAQEGKNILVFVPGKREIKDTIDDLERLLPPELRTGIDILPLHSKLSDHEQKLATHSSGRQRIVVSTNVAQTSLTIPDIDAVVDSGMERRVEINKQGVEGLMLRPISKADCMQRRGRAGRVKEGLYILTRLNDDEQHVPFIQRDDYPVAEILRSDTSRHILRTAAAGVDFRTLDLVHPLDSSVIDRAELYLQKLGAVDENGNVTSTGYRMNEFPVRPSLGRMLVEADQLSLERRAYTAATAAAMEAGGLRYFSQDVGRRWKKLTDETLSDQLAELDIFLQAAQGNMSKLRQVGYDLDMKSVERAKELYGKLRKKMGVDEGQLLPPTEEERKDVLQCLYAGFADDIYRHIGDGKYQRIVESDKDEARTISNRSVVQGHPRMIGGSPYRYERKTREGWEEKHIIGDVSVIDSVAALARAASHLCAWRSSGLRWHEGSPMQLQRQYFADEYDLGSAREVTPEPSPELREAIIQYALEHPGSAQRELRDIKKTLEDLRHLTKRPLQQFTQDMLIAFVQEAAPVDIIDPDTIEMNLRAKMQQEGINLDHFVSSEERDDIKTHAPEYIQATSRIGFHVQYRSGTPYVTQYSPDDVASLPGELYLPDGRHVLFAGMNGKRLSREKLLELLAEKK